MIKKFKPLLSSIRQFKWTSLLCIITVTIEVILEVLCPYLMADLINEGIFKKQMDQILHLGLIIFIMYMFSLLTGFLAGHFAAISSVGFAGNLRSDMFKNVESFSFRNIDKFSAASIVTRMTTDVTNVQNAYQMLVRIAVRAPMMIVFALIMTFRINRDMVPLFITVMPITALILGILSFKAFPVFKKIFKQYDHLNNTVEENLKGIRVVKAYVREEDEIVKFTNLTATIARLFAKAQKILALVPPLMQATTFTMMLLISWKGAHLILNGSMNPGQIVSLIQYSFQILIQLINLSMIFVMLTMSQVSAGRINELLSETTTISRNPDGHKNLCDGSIVFDHVNFSYTDRPDALTLHNISLKIDSGEHVGIIGASGSGKSTLVNLIARLYDITSGHLTVGGKPISSYDLKSLREQVAVVLQKNILFTGTVASNIRWGDADASDEKIMESCQLAQAHDFITQFEEGYDHPIEQGGSNVSGGQRQRLCIARALIRDPKILILDDSTSAVDMTTEAKIRHAFNTKLPSTTKIMISQRINSIKDCDKIIVMDHGRIVDIGTHEELHRSCALYQEFEQTQNQGDDANEEKTRPEIA